MGGISNISSSNVDTLVRLYKQFQNSQIRLLLAFRHAEVEDPFCMLHLLARDLPAQARLMGVSLQLPTHSNFIYDRGMTIWAGDWLGWLFARLGGIPIHRGKPLDRSALKQARELLINGKFPLTIAPEGATNGHGEVVSPLELGAAQLACWCAEDLHKAQRPDEVIILPISLRYLFIAPPWQEIEQLLSQLERDSGVNPPEGADLYERLLSLGKFFLGEMEAFYQRFYHCAPVVVGEGDRHQVLRARLDQVLDNALGVAEAAFGIEKQGTLVDRCRRLEEVSWNAIYREDISNIEDLTPLQRGLANWCAEEALLKVRHMRLVESLVAVTGTYVRELPSAERFAETLWILFDVMARIKGVKTPRRPFLGPRQVKIRVCEPLPVRARWEAVQGKRSATKQLVNDLTQELEASLSRAACLDI
jgi:hypothetical protein